MSQVEFLHSWFIMILKEGKISVNIQVIVYQMVERFKSALWLLILPILDSEPVKKKMALK